MKKYLLQCTLIALLISLSASHLSSQEYFGPIKMPANGGENMIKAASNDVLYASIWGLGLHRSSDDGNSWIYINNGINSQYINDIALNSSDHIFVATAGSGVFRSTDSGVSWEDVTGDIHNKHVKSLLVTRDDYVFAGTYGGGIYMSKNNGDSWSESNVGLMYRDVTAMIELRNGFISAATYGDGTYMTRDTGKTWKVENSSLTNLYVHEFAENQQGDIFAATNGKGIVYSVNNGISWAEFDSLYFADGMSEAERLPDFNATCVVINQNNEPIMGTRNFGIFYYDGDLYNHWQRPLERNNGITDIAVNSQGKLFATQVDGTILVSEDDGRNWSETAEIMQSEDFNVYPHKDGKVYAFLGTNFYLSPDRGESWQQKGTIAADVNDVSIDSSGNILAATLRGLYRSTNDGGTFNQVAYADTNVKGVEITPDNEAVVVWRYIEENDQGELILDTSMISFSPDLISWENFNVELDAPPTVMRVDDGGVIYYLNQEGYIEYTPDKGQNWKQSEQLNNPIKDFHFIPNIIVAITNNTIALSSSYGQSWSKKPVPDYKNINYTHIRGTGNREVYVAASYRPSVFGHQLIFKTTDNGDNWDSVFTSVTTSKLKDINSNLAGDVYVYTGLLYRAFSEETLEKPVLEEPGEGTIVQDFNIELSWKSAFKADLYQLQISPSTTYGYMWEEITLSDTSHSVYRSLDPNTTYHWRVRSKNNEALSGWTERSFKTTLGSPVLISPSDDSSGVATKTNLVWEEVDGADEYHLQVARDEMFSDIVIDDNGITQTNPEVVLPGSTELFWRVKAKNDETEGHWSETWSFITVLGPPALISPMDEMMDVPVTGELMWHTEPNALSYLTEISLDTNFTNKVDSVNISDTVYTYSRLDYNTKYYWRARSVGENGFSEYSFIWEFTTKMTPVVLTAPDSSAVNQPADVTLDWEEHAELDQYELLVSNSPDFADTLVHESTLSKTEYELTGLKNNKSFYWKVRAYNIGRTAAWSYTWEFTTIITSPVLRSPQNGSDGHPTELTFIWFKIEGALSYQLQIARDQEFNDLIFSKDSLTEVSNVVGALEPNTTYYWRVRAFNENGSTDWSEVWSFTTFDIKPMLISPENESSGVAIPITFLWHSIEEAETYQLQVSRDAEFNDLIFSKDQIQDTTYSVDQLETDQEYFWRVRGISEDFTSNWSEVWNLTTSTNSVNEFIDPEINLYPNPASGEISIFLNIKKYSKVNVSLVNAAGSTLKAISSEYLNQGLKTITTDVSGYSQGSYFIIIEVNGAFLNKQLKIIK